MKMKKIVKNLGLLILIIGLGIFIKYKIDENKDDSTLYIKQIKFMENDIHSKFDASMIEKKDYETKKLNGVPYDSVILSYKELNDKFDIFKFIPCKTKKECAFRGINQYSKQRYNFLSITVMSYAEATQKNEEDFMTVIDIYGLTQKECLALAKNNWQEIYKDRNYLAFTALGCPILFPGNSAQYINCKENCPTEKRAKNTAYNDENFVKACTTFNEKGLGTKLPNIAKDCYRFRIAVSTK